MKPHISIASATYTGRNLHGQVVNEMGRRVVGGVYPSGAVLPNEEQLCQELQVSRTALREAVKVLAAKGLLESTRLLWVSTGLSLGAIAAAVVGLFLPGRR
jgi:DNA-binding transcriptional regulator YhcF (GntR family)